MTLDESIVGGTPDHVADTDPGRRVRLRTRASRRFTRISRLAWHSTRGDSARARPAAPEHILAAV